jgi:hypothetical protein
MQTEQTVTQNDTSAQAAPAPGGNIVSIPSQSTAEVFSFVSESRKIKSLISCGVLSEADPETADEIWRSADRIQRLSEYIIDNFRVIIPEAGSDLNN